MKLLLAIAIGLGLSIEVVNGFQLNVPSNAFGMKGSALKAVLPQLRNKAAGYGAEPFLTPSQQPIYTLFDPDVQSKLMNSNSVKDRVTQGASYSYSENKAVHTYEVGNKFRFAKQVVLPDIPSTLTPCLSFLEYLDTDQVTNLPISPPVNTIKPNAPFAAKIIGSADLIADDAPGIIKHVVISGLPPGFNYVEGQSLSVTPPGTDPKTGKAFKPRLYSIASSRYGDLGDGGTVSLCVRLAEYWDPVTKSNDASKIGVCSNFLCDPNAVGKEVLVAGPVGKTMLLPTDPKTDVIMVGTGTGVAPFRSFLLRLFGEENVASHMYTGRAWLFLGVPVTSGLLYDEEFQSMKENSGGRFEVSYAISREQETEDGRKMYVQDRLEVEGLEVFNRLESGAHIYFCGLKGMMDGVLKTMESIATKKGVDYTTWMKGLKKEGRWHVEVY